MEVESLKKLKTNVEKCIEDLAKKPDISPSETKAALDGMHLRKFLCEEIEDCEMDAGYSERRHYSREGRSSYDRNGNSQMGYSGYPRYGIGGWYHNDVPPMYPMRNSYGSYCDPYAPGYMYGPNEGYSDRKNYSGHSVADRIVSKLEKMMDTEESDYERQEVQKFIHMIRQAEMQA